jgi:hypothetical protein
MVSALQGVGKTPDILTLKRRRERQSSIDIESGNENIPAPIGCFGAVSADRR